MAVELTLILPKTVSLTLSLIFQAIPMMFI